jgi:deazaflavin-dependent oxidoreductase (nitroreductase family)
VWQWLGQRQLVIRAAANAAPLDAALVRRTRGRVRLLGVLGLKQCLITTTGRKTGQPRTVTLLFGRRDGQILLVGSNFGQQHHPAWALNLEANPKATVDIDGVAETMVARMVTDPAEREQVWQIMYDLWPAYRTYRGTAGREIKLFALTPARG